MKSPTKLSALAVGLVALAAAGSASAGSTSANMNLSLTVEPECMLTVNDWADVASGLTNSQENSLEFVRVLCNQGTAYQIEVDQGQHYGQARADMRAMASGSNFIAYELYQDLAASVVWGEGSDAITGVGSLGGSWITHYPTMEFFMSGSPSGVYTDDLLVTLNWADI